MKLFAINIGNTNTQYGMFEDGKFGEVKTCLTADLTADIIPKGVQVAVTSVVPEKNELFKGDDVFFLTPFTENELDTSLVDNSTIGPDRMANAVALAKFAKLPAICIDCGTAITFEAVDAKNTFRGGAIMAGRMMLRKALNDYTAKLPLSQRFDAKRPSALGRNTHDAIISGCDVGVLGAAQKLIKKMQIELGVEKCQVIATGGDADFFADNLIEISSGGKDFTLRGLVAAYKFAHKNGKDTEKNRIRNLHLMKCPVCADIDLVRTPYEGVAVDLCPSCHGFLLSTSAMKNIERNPEMAQSILEEEAQVMADTAHEVRCPKCHISLKKTNAPHGLQFKIDVCHSCNIIWLDSGELESIQLAYEASPAGQDNRRRREEMENMSEERQQQLQEGIDKAPDRISLADNDSYRYGRHGYGNVAGNFIVDWLVNSVFRF